MIVVIFFSALTILLAPAATASFNDDNHHLEEGSSSPFYGLPYQSLDTPYYGQHVGVAYADLNGDGVNDILFAAGRHWVDQSYALINLGPMYDDDGEFVGVKFSKALPIGSKCNMFLFIALCLSPILFITYLYYIDHIFFIYLGPGAYYQIDVTQSDKTDDTTQHSTVLLVGGTCHVEKSNDFGSCNKGDNTPARVVHVTMSKEDGKGCSIHEPDTECTIEFTDVWEHPSPKGDRNGGFATFNGDKMIALLGQGGIELFQSVETDGTPSDYLKTERQRRNLLHTTYSSVYHHEPPAKTDPRSDYARYAGFGAGHLPSGGVIAAGRRSDYGE